MTTGTATSAAARAAARGWASWPYPVSPLVFINYRSQDEPFVAGFLYRELARRYGCAAVFLDHESLPPGTRFDDALLTAVRRSSVMLSVIGPRWVSATDDFGRNLLARKGDWVRREIAMALRSGVTVTPIFVGDTKSLQPADLPPNIRSLAVFQGWHLRHHSLGRDLDELMNDLETLEPRLLPARPASVG